MRKKIVFLLALALVLALGMVLFVSAGGRRWGRPARPWAMMDGGKGLIETLGLTDEQLTKLKEIEKATYEKIKGLRNELQDLLFAIRQLKLTKNPDEAAIEEKMEQAKKLQEQIRTIQEDRWEKIKSLLTKEQLEKLATPRWGRRGGRMGPEPWWF
ncbi:MAG: periplasmic heavy metal sensor [Firmicutes bacterium]|nr:periplasmic heavy metal sensor [Bacillota bacterium]